MTVKCSGDTPLQVERYINSLDVHIAETVAKNVRAKLCTVHTITLSHLYWWQAQGLHTQKINASQKRDENGL